MNALTERLSGAQVRSLMRSHHVTIAGLAAKMAIPKTRVRHVREHGVSGKAFCTDWLEAIGAQTPSDTAPAR